MKEKIVLFDLLNNNEDFDQDEDQCFTCKDLVTDPITCLKCPAVFCLKCMKKDQPCKKCKSKQGFQNVQPKQFQLTCPFSPECSQNLTPQTFIHHILTSPHIPQHVLLQYKQSLGNICQIGHALTLMIDTFKNLTSQQCFNCKKVGLARLQCEQCNVIYCVKCRPIKFINGTCNQNHKLSHVIPKQNLPFLCDKCGENKKNPKGYYIDKKCNIGICEHCYEIIQKDK